MIALLKRDGPFAALLTLLGTIGLVVALVQDQFREVWVFEPSKLEGTFYTAWGAGLVLGAVVAIKDRMNGVHDYVRHRPLSSMQLHAARIATLLLVLAGWWVLAPLGSWIVEFVGGRLAGVGRLDHAGAVFASMAPAASAAALALLCASLPLAWWIRAVLAAGLLIVGFPMCEEIATAATSADPQVFALAHLGMAISLLALSFPFAAVDRDPDRSWTPRVPRWSLALLLAIGVAGYCVPLTMLAGWTASHLERTYPLVAPVGNGHGLIRWEQVSGARDRRAVVVDADHEPTGRVLGSGGLAFAHQPISCVAKDPEIEPPQFGSRGFEALRVDRHGLANCLLRDPVDWSENFFVFGRGDRTTPFRTGVRLVSIGADGHASRVVATLQSAVWAVEPEAAEVYRFDPLREEVRSVPIPDGDRAVAVVQQESDDPRAHESLDQPSALLHCERGVYVFGLDGLLPADPRAIAAIDARKAAREARREDASRPRFEIAVPDALAPTVRLVDASGKVVFEHAYAPRTLLEKAAYAMNLLPSLARPPLLQIGANLFANEEPLVFTPFVDPVVAGGRRAWLVFANCIVSGLLAAASRRRLRRAGADARTLRFWSIAVALTGLLGALLCEWFEPSRAWRVPAATPAPAPRIRTGDAA